MLVMTRKINERIVIGDDITVTVVDIRDGKARIGIEAPREVPVHRLEVYEAILAEQAEQQDKRPDDSSATDTESDG